MKTPPRPWRPDELATARKMRAAGVSFAEIGRVLGRAKTTVQGRLDRLDCPTRNVVHKEEPPPDHVLWERDALYAHVQTPNEFWLGDPPPSRSALAARSS
jgi:hypothetical protein